MLHVFHEIINSLGVFIPLINWWAVTSFIDSLLKFVSSWLDYKTACKLATDKMYRPAATSSRRRNPRQQTRVRRRQHKSSQ